MREKLIQLVEETRAADPVDGAREDLLESLAAVRDGDKAEQVLDQLRHHLKYLIFDLEATRRENKYLRRMLDLRAKRRDGEEDSDAN